jgi:hypothetical protein
MDAFEKHIIKDREEMDIHDPDPELWKRIENDLPGHERHTWRVLGRAAVALIIVGAGLAVIFRIIHVTEKNNDPRITAVKETYIYYNSQIRSLYEEAAPLLTANPDISHELEDGMSELDSLSAQIRKDLSDNIASEEVIEALIRNYRLRIELLEDMLALMKEKEKEKENTNSTDHEL